jgi:hypothetical protein
MMKRLLLVDPVGHLAPPDLTPTWPWLAALRRWKGDHHATPSLAD